jgi:DinB superfamily
MTTKAYPDPRRMGMEVSLARGLEAGGYYNLAKLLWALAYADEIRRSQIGGVPRGEEPLVRDLIALRQELELSGASADTLAYLERGTRGVANHAELQWSEAGKIAVCRACGHLLLGMVPERCPGCGAWRLTFRFFLPVHFLEPLEPGEAVQALGSTPLILEGLLEGLTADQAARPSAPGEWSMREGLHHILVTEVLLSGRVRQILDTDRPKLAGLAAWAERLEGDLGGQEIFQRFRQSRRATVERLRGLSLDQWHRQGEHEEFGPVTLLQQASYFARHDQSHLVQLEGIREAVLD